MRVELERSFCVLLPFALVVTLAWGCGSTKPSPPSAAPAPAVSVPDDVASSFAAVQAFRYEPYAGVQRGADGTEDARAGNSADLALALSARLKRQGYKTRIAVGRLADSALGTLLFQLTAPGFDAPKVGENPAPIYHALDDDRVTAVSRDHHWVEVALSGDWVALDPSFSQAVTGQSFATASEYPSEQSLPRQGVSFVLKQKVGNRVQELGRHDGTVEALRHRRISLVMRGAPTVAEPSSSPAPPAGGGMLGGGMAGGGLAGALTGNRKPKPNPAKGEVTSITYVHELKVGETSNALKGSTWKKGGIDRQWLEISVTAPGQAARTVEQPLFDRRANEAPPLRRRVELAVVAGPLSRSTFERVRGQHEGALNEVASGPDVTKMKASATTVQRARSQDERAGAAAFMTALQMAHESDTATMALGRTTAVRPVYARPRVLAVHTASTLHGQAIKTETSIDLRIDTLLAIPYEGAPVRAAANFSAARGMAESALEGEVLSSMLGGRDVVTTAALMAEAHRRNVDMQVVTAENKSDLRKVGGLSPPDRARIERAIAGGHDVILPRRAVPLHGKRRQGWWQVSTTTGEVIGVMEGGLHQAVVSTTIKVQSVGLNPRLGYVFGALAGSIGVHTLVAAEILKNHHVTKEAKEAIMKKLLAQACAVCPVVNVSVTFDLTYKSDCFGFRQSAMLGANGKYFTAGLGGRIGIDFCKGYGKGLKCAVGFFLDGLEEATDIEFNDDESNWNGHFEHPANCEERTNTNVDHDF